MSSSGSSTAFSRSILGGDKQGRRRDRMQEELVIDSDGEEGQVPLCWTEGVLRGFVIGFEKR